jgi:hypothetical protein
VKQELANGLMASAKPPHTSQVGVRVLV